MGQYFIDRAHYTKSDHFVCMVEGQGYLRLVPHIYRHEIYAGESFLEDDYKTGGTKSMNLIARESPVNLFDINFKVFPKAKHVAKEHVFSIYLKKGDCIYIPAFYFYQFAAEAETTAVKGSYKPSAIMVNIHYKGNSDLLQAFYKLVETKVLE